MLTKLIVSQSQDPYENLALEDWLYRHALSNQGMVFCYVNTPCVVIGRAQNPWREANVSFCQEHNIPIVRRQSGGGTVFHDDGNLNISFIQPKQNYNKAWQLDQLIGALTKLGITATRNDRNDVLVTHKTTPYKISGSAFRESKDRAFHHFTLLVNSKLDALKAALHSPLDIINAKGVNSVRSPVCNLTQLQSTITIDAIITELANILGIPIERDIHFDDDYISRKSAEYRSWDWLFGKTLSFQAMHGDTAVTVDRGIIVAMSHQSFGHLLDTPYQPNFFD